MSDGFPELFNENKEMLGYNTAKSEFLKYGEGSTETILNNLKDRIIDWAGGRRPDDDVTFVVIKMK